MMPGKRALVVDDSRSARVVLSRMLERYGILVDPADSAESALEYLKTRRPDVIFMDHLMPGMDGLQAVREIKANPELAGIPIMMYTSQEGEIYCGQARASGAVGVLPKSIRPIDVTKALYQLKLLPDRRDGEPSGLEAIGGPATPEPPPPPAGTPAAASIEALLREQHQELRKFVVASLESVVRRVVAELHQRDAVHVAGEETVRAPAAPPARPWAQWLAAAAALAALAALTILYWQARVEASQAERAVQALTASNDTLTKAIEKWRIAGETSADTAAQEGFRPLVLAVPFGEQALNATRLESVSALVAQLERAAISGTVRIENFSGSFCLASTGQDGYTLAPPAASAEQCEQIGNPFDDAQAGAARQPIAFANLASTVRRRTGGAIELELVAGSRDRLAVAYPPVEQATAGQWNAAAQANNRVEISIVER
jgi:CheY-like chemotaxis protein